MVEQYDLTKLTPKLRETFTTAKNIPNVTEQMLKTIYDKLVEVSKK